MRNEWETVSVSGSTQLCITTTRLQCAANEIASIAIVDGRFHCSRSAVIGSSPAARRAGSHDARAEIAKNTTVMLAKVAGSVASLPPALRTSAE